MTDGRSFQRNGESGSGGIIGRVMLDGVPVIYRLVDEAPSAETRAQFPWLTVIAWEYDGSTNNGMPDAPRQEAMERLERRLEGLLDDGLAMHAYNRTGKHLKELVYYVRDRDEFIDALNKGLRDDARYPIEISFYEDDGWQDFEALRASFREAHESG